MIRNVVSDLPINFLNYFVIAIRYLSALKILIRLYLLSCLWRCHSPFTAEDHIQYGLWIQVKCHAQNRSLLQLEREYLFWKVCISIHVGISTWKFTRDIFQQHKNDHLSIPKFQMDQNSVQIYSLDSPKKQLYTFVGFI